MRPSDTDQGKCSTWSQKPTLQVWSSWRWVADTYRNELSPALIASPPRCPWCLRRGCPGARPAEHVRVQRIRARSFVEGDDPCGPAFGDQGPSSPRSHGRRECFTRRNPERVRGFQLKSGELLGAVGVADFAAARSRLAELRPDQRYIHRGKCICVKSAIYQDFGLRYVAPK